MLIARDRMVITRKGKGVLLAPGDEIPPDADGIENFAPHLVHDTEAPSGPTDRVLGINVADSTVREVIGYVLDHPDDAEAVLAAELAADKPRSGVVQPLENMVASAGGSDEGQPVAD